MSSRNIKHEILMGLGLAIVIGIAMAALISIGSAGQLTTADMQVLQDFRNFLAPYLSPRWIIVAMLLMVVLPLVVLMNQIGWSSKFFGYHTVQQKAVARIWRIILGIGVVLALSQAAIVLDKVCGLSPFLAKLCGG